MEDRSLQAKEFAARSFRLESSTAAETLVPRTQFLCVIPVEMARWGVVAAACLLSTLFLALNIRGHILHTTENWYLIVLAVVALHLALGLVLKLYFFTYFSFSL